MRNVKKVQGDLSLRSEEMLEVSPLWQASSPGRVPK